MNKRIGFVTLLMVFTVWVSLVPVYAGNGVGIEGGKEIKNVNQYSSAKSARVVGTPRGEFLSSVDIELSNKGKGTMGIYAEMLCHEPVKKIRMWINLEKWISEEEVWQTVRGDQFSWLAEDFPDEDLTMAIVSYEVPKLDRGQDYRVRGMFGIDSFGYPSKESWTIHTPNFFLD